MRHRTRESDAGRRVWMQCTGSGYAAEVPTKRSTPQHTVAVDDALWQTARRIAAKRHEKISDVLRQALVRYVQRHKHLLDDDA
jgi:hypothetical protein